MSECVVLWQTTFVVAGFKTLTFWFSTQLKVELKCSNPLFSNGDGEPVLFIPVHSALLALSCTLLGSAF